VQQPVLTLLKRNRKAIDDLGLVQLLVAVIDKDVINRQEMGRHNRTFLSKTQRSRFYKRIMLFFSKKTGEK